MTLVQRRATTPEGRGSLKSVGASALMGFVPREDIGWACSGCVFHLSPFNEATGVLGSEVSFWETCLKLWHSGFTKEQGNEAELLPPLSSGSVLLPTVPPPPAQSLLWPTCPHLAFPLPPCDDSGDISSLDPSPRPDASAQPLHPHLTVGANRPLRELWPCCSPHPEAAKPTLAVEARHLV